MVSVVKAMEGKKWGVDIHQARTAYQTLVTPGQIVEIRALDALYTTDREPYAKPRTISGYFDNESSFLAALKSLGQTEGVYLTINQCQPALLAKSNNRLKDRKVTTTKDEQIIHRQWLFLDLDPVRAGGIAGIPADEAEHKLAFEFAQTIRSALHEEGWPDPVRIDSGNGSYLLYRIDLPPDDHRLVERTLAGLAARFDTQDIHVDQTGFNPARIIRIPGTWNCKGDGTKERQHRLARFLEVPAEILSVSQDLLEAIAIPEQSEETPRPAPAGTAQSQGHKADPASPEDFFQRHNIRYKEKAGTIGKKVFILLDGCVFNPEHTAPDASIVVRPNGKWGYECFHDSCQEKGWQDFRRHFEPHAYGIKPTPVTPVKKNTARVKKETDLDESSEDKKPSALELLTQIASEAKYIVTPGGDLFARVPVNGHHETVSINEKGSGFRRWLIYCFDQQYGYIPNSEALTQIMERVKARASYEGEQAKVYTRIAEKNGRVYLDMGNEQWECIEISAQEWRVINNPPVYFRRPNGMGALPYPRKGGSLEDLRQIINVKNDKDFILIVGWLLGTLHPTGPYAVLNLNGEGGSGKSRAETYLRCMIDPSEAPTRNAPRDEREAAITAQNNMIVALDNLSSIPLWLSDVLCRIATGSGFSTRALYEDEQEKIFSSKRPIIVNGIEDGIISQGDLLSRTILVTLQQPTKYIREEVINKRFHELHPFLLGALLTAASLALRDRDKVHLDTVPRMADFAYWVTAAEPALKWETGTFSAAFTENQATATSIVTDASPVAKAIKQFMEKQSQAKLTNTWTGLVSDLHDELQIYEVYANAKRAPKDAARLGGQLKRVAPSLRAQGIDIQPLGRNKQGSSVSIQVLIQTENISSSGVGKEPSGVGKIPSGVGKMPSGVGKNLLPTPHITPHTAPIAGLIGVGGVGNSPHLSIPLSSANFLEEGKKEAEIQKPDRVCKIPTPPTLISSLSEAEREKARLLPTFGEEDF